MAYLRWPPFDNHDVITASYDVITCRCGPQSKRLWMYYLSSKSPKVIFLLFKNGFFGSKKNIHDLYMFDKAVKEVILKVEIRLWLLLRLKESRSRFVICDLIKNDNRILFCFVFFKLYLRVFLRIGFQFSKTYFFFFFTMRRNDRNCTHVNLKGIRVFIFSHDLYDKTCIGALWRAK